MAPSVLWPLTQTVFSFQLAPPLQSSILEHCKSWTSDIKEAHRGFNMILIGTDIGYLGVFQNTLRVVPRSVWSNKNHSSFLNIASVMKEAEYRMLCLYTTVLQHRGTQTQTGKEKFLAHHCSYVCLPVWSATSVLPGYVYTLDSTKVLRDTIEEVAFQRFIFEKHSNNTVLYWLFSLSRYSGTCLQSDYLESGGRRSRGAGSSTWDSISKIRSIQ